MKNVVVYSTPTCPFCRRLKEFLATNNVKYENFDVTESDDKMEEMIEKSGQMGVPVIVIDGQTIVGFNKERLSAVLEI